jgi:kynurenine formamidase
MMCGPIDVIDLSLPLDAQTSIFSQGEYRDPPLEICTWAEIASVGYAVQAVSLGTQTGTHLDMPAHFVAGGRSTSDLDPRRLVGPAVVIDLGPAPGGADLLAWRQPAAAPGVILLLRAHAEGTCLSAGALDELVAWKAGLVILAGALSAAGAGYPVLAALLRADIPVVEDVDPLQAARVADGDWLVAAPLPLQAAGGAPCRVLAIRPKARFT